MYIVARGQGQLLRIALDRDARVPLYRQIIDQVAAQVRAGQLSAGFRLPPVRQLAMQYGLTRLTVHSAYAELAARGLVDAHVGRGTFVSASALDQPDGRIAGEAPGIGPGVLAELLRMRERPGLLSFAQAAPPPASFPREELGAALQAAIADAEALSYGPIQGDAGLRSELVSVLAERGVRRPPEEILVTGGAQQGIDLAVRALVPPGGTILVEEPTYSGVLELAAQSGRRLAGVAGDAAGIRPDLLEAACRATEPRLLYLVPTFGNPTGMSLAPDRRRAILRLARTHRFYILEDDVYGRLAYDGVSPALAAEDSAGRVIYLTSFSKMLAPALRLGAIAASPGVLAMLAGAKQSSDLVSSSLLQRALALYLRAGHLQGHLERVCTLYRERRDAMLAALARELPECSVARPAGGLNLWLRLPPGVSERSVAADAIDAGVGVAQGRYFFPQPQPSGFLRLSYSLHEPEQIDAGIDLLAGVIRRHEGTLARARQVAAPLV